jgi:adenine-specific DNA methylase
MFKLDKYMEKLVPIDKALPTSGHSSMYLMHKFFARKQADIIREYIKNHTFTGEIVLDPFCGSGVMVGEALRLNRRVIGIDINPVAIYITRNTINSSKIENIIEEFEKIERDIAADIDKLYMTKCRKCDQEIPAICFTWDNNSLIDVRYECPKHGKKISKISSEDMRNLHLITEKKMKEYFDSEEKCLHWYPKNKLSYGDGTPFLKKERYNSVDELFTFRNIIALAKLYSRIKNITDRNLQESFKFAFSSMTHLASKMTPVRPSRPFSSAWLQQSYWYCPNFMESNVWNLFKRSVCGKQGLIKAKEDIPENFVNFANTDHIKTFLENQKYDYSLIEGTITSLDELKENSIDYVITDPPYGHSIQYGELLFMWGLWLGLMDNFNSIAQKEIIKNPRQNKGDKEYENLLTRAFKKIFKVLKPGRYCTVTFHNPNMKYRYILYRSVMVNGFELEKIIYQPPPRPSAKSLLQPFGSLEGD